MRPFIKPLSMLRIPSFSKDQQVDKSLRHSIKDGIAFSVMTGSAESYFSAFAIFLKASTQQVALLASLPPLLASFSQLAAVYLGQKTGARKEVVVAGAIIQLLALVCVAVFPVLFHDHSFVLLLGFVVLYFVGPNLGAPLWGSLMGAIVPENVRGRFFGARTRLSSVASFSSLIIAGLVLQFFDSLALTYYGFACIYGLGVVARGVSAWHLSQLHDPPHVNSLPGDVSNLFKKGFFRGQSGFLKFSVFYACMQGAVAISGPLVVVYLLRVLEFSYIELTINTAASVLVQFLVLSRWGRLSDLFGNRIILRLTGFMIPLVPMLWILSADFYYLLFVQAISGLLWSGFSLSTSNSVYDMTDQNKRAGLMAVHALLAASSVFVGAIFGGWLTVHLPTEVTLFGRSFSWLTSIYGVFVISTLFRLIVAFAFLPRLPEVRDVKAMTYHGLFFRVTRFSPISGVIFEAVSRRKKSDGEDI
jgi:MFS family permease